MQSDLERLKNEYADRTTRLAGSELFSLSNKLYHFMIQQRQRDAIALLNQQAVFPLKDKRILDVGCGNGGVLLEYLTFGANPKNLYGTDLLPYRVATAHAKLSDLPLACSDAQHLPYTSNSFDLLIQHTMFSSILDDHVKTNIAHEMLRVLRSDGVILWYDFWFNPTNSQTKGIRPDEIRKLFPGCSFTFRRITLAPPITRRLVGFSWLLCAFLEKLRLLNSHYLVVIRSPID